MHIVESVQAWRERLRAINARVYKPVSLVIKGDNYLLKMREDTAFLIDSFLSEFFEFSSRIDPFLVSASKPSGKKINLPIAHAMMKRIKACEAVLL